MVDQIRFGRLIADLPLMLDFGSWGMIDMSAALDAFGDVLAWFDREDVIKSEKDRASMILAARRYHDGNHVKPLKVNPGDTDDNVLLNLCRALVDDSVSWLFGNPETGVLKIELEQKFEETPEATPNGEPESEPEAAGSDVGDLLEAMYEASGGFHFYKRLGLRGCVAGHSFVKLIQNAGDKTPRAVVLDPMLCSVRTDPVDTDQATAYKIEWTREETDPMSKRRDTYIYRQLVVNAGALEEPAWVIADFKTKDRRKREWMLVNGPWAWPWSWSPVHDCRNVEAGWGYYGLSDMEDVAGLNDAVNFIASNTMRILKFHAHPKTIGTGFTADDLQETSIDSFWSIDNPDAEVKNLEMQSDLASSLAFLDFIRTAFWSIGRGLDPSVFKDKVGQITNFALRVLAIRAIHKMGDKRLTYGKMLRDLNTHALEMLGRPGVKTIIVWPDSMPEDPAAVIDQLEREVGLGIVSRQTAAEERGRSWDVERERIRNEKEENASLGEYLIEQFDRGGGAFGANQNGGNRNVDDNARQSAGNQS